jgi:hypothetical protein
MVEVRPTNLFKEISTMTTATMALTELAEKGADIDVLRQMVQFMAQRLMELDVEGRCGAVYDEKGAGRRAQGARCPTFPLGGMSKGGEGGGVERSTTRAEGNATFTAFRPAPKGVCVPGLAALTRRDHQRRST